ncbi:hypothetical protein [Puia dinghuensis]|uniref:Uncharacterized protein n=1 Tax=Puia dinghuensis TaxID=1792502 RepID=A0A8J2UCQ7_9BACT|nr:hypothetical protein [Puia dinghuensis]GGA96557.1 hypothetical protein GCM10011511_19810 [Puia dinghuensis]
MIKFFVSIILIALLSFICGLFLPWWTIAVAAFAVIALIPQKPLAAFFAGFLALFLLWGGLAWAIDAANTSILSVRVASMLYLQGSSILLVLVTGFIGALVGGGGAITASFMLTRGRAR